MRSPLPESMPCHFTVSTLGGPWTYSQAKEGAAKTPEAHRATSRKQANTVCLAESLITYSKALSLSSYLGGGELRGSRFGSPCQRISACQM
jgi:hypothetical protein